MRRTARAAAPQPARIRETPENAPGRLKSRKTESERPIVAATRGNARRAKGPWLFRAGNGPKHGAVVRKDR